MVNLANEKEINGRKLQSGERGYGYDTTRSTYVLKRAKPYAMHLFAHPYTWLQKCEGRIEDVEINIGSTELWIIFYVFLLISRGGHILLPVCYKNSLLSGY